MQFCTNHPDRKALSVCRGCGKPYCKDCLVEGKEYYYCRRPQCQDLMRLESPAAQSIPANVVCPNCSAGLQLTDDERSAGKFHCPECGAFLDYTVNPPVALRKKNYAEVFSSVNQGDIAVLKSLLDDSDIDYYVAGEAFLATYPLIEPVRFFVLEGQAEEAREILKRFNASAFGLSAKKRPLQD